MKNILLFLFVCTISINAYSQISFQEHVVTTNINSPTSVYTVDIDGDGDLDLLFNSAADNKIVWSANLDGQGDFDLPQIISTSFNGTNSIYPSDIDDDGDIDVISTEWEIGIVAWYENTDGLGSFGVKQIITTNVDYVNDAYAADLDSDGDLDVISTSYPNKLAWYENLDGLGAFGVQNIISLTHDTPGPINAVDIDNDGDVDVICSSFGDGKIAWYQNIDGLGNFGTQQIITWQAEGARDTFAVDIDNDNDFDILSTSSLFYGKVAWYENIDSFGTFGAEQIITTNVMEPSSITASDLDNDGDVDVLSASRFDNKIAWYENTDGLGNFGVQQIISTNAENAFFVTTSDVNVDGKMDVLSTSINDDKLAWYENLGTLSLAEFTTPSILIYPNPTSNFLRIQSKNGISKIEILNSIGQIVLINQNEDKINISNLNQNIYFCKVTDINGNFEFRKIIKK